MFHGENLVVPAEEMLDFLPTFCSLVQKHSLNIYKKASPPGRQEGDALSF
jgi:hypothetical protein